MVSVRSVAFALVCVTAVSTFGAPKDWNFSVSEREIFVDHAQNGRSGHMGHALVDAGNGRILDFYSNCDGQRCDGHSGYGWMEYRISDDYGRTFGPAKALAYSRRLYEEGKHTALCEKAVRDPNGRILLFFQITDATKPISCEPWSEPTVAVSEDRGETFSDGIGTGADPGRIYDVICDGQDVYFITQANAAEKSFLGSEPKHVYKVWKGNVGRFVPTVLPIDAKGKGYGALSFMKDGSLIAYVYDSKRETEPEYTISTDRGKTWSAPKRTLVAKKIRNPQLRRIGDDWLLAGRNGGAGEGIVLYSSKDGIQWDDGEMIDWRPPKSGTGYYSNMLPIFEPGQAPRVLLQYSHVYDACRVNIAHRTITFGDGEAVRSRLSLETDFPGGNVVVDAIVGNVANIRPDERDSTGECAPRHWAFRVRNAAGRRYGFKFPAGSPFGYVSTRGPAVSRDNGVSWRWMTSGSPENPEDFFEYAFGADENDVIFAWQPLYSGETLRRFVEGVAPSAGLRLETLCQTEKGRAAELLRLGREDNPGKVGILFFARHHANEMWSSFILEGVLKEIAKESEAGRYLRGNASFFVVPFVDKDGVEDGDPGKSRQPHDHNRDYDKGRYSTVRAIREKAERWAADKKTVIGFDFHACSLELRGKRLECPDYTCLWRPTEWAHWMMFQIVGSAPCQMARFARFTELLQAAHRNDREFIQYRPEESVILPGSVEAGLCRWWMQDKLHASYAATCEFPFARPDGQPNTIEATDAMGAHFAQALAAFVRECGEGRQEPSQPTAELPAPDMISPVPNRLRSDTRRYIASPSITVTSGGRLWAAWLTGEKGAGEDNAVIVVTSGDRGKSWSEPMFALDMEGPLHFRNPLIWTDAKGQLWLLFEYLDGRQDGRAELWATQACYPEDTFITWTVPRRVDAGDPKEAVFRRMIGGSCESSR